MCPGARAPAVAADRRIGVLRLGSVDAKETDSDNGVVEPDANGVPVADVDDDALLDLSTGSRRGRRGNATGGRGRGRGGRVGFARRTASGDTEGERHGKKGAGDHDVSVPAFVGRW